jgi:hypothetical protein
VLQQPSWESSTDSVRSHSQREAPSRRQQPALILLNVLFGQDDVERRIGRADAVAHTAGA